MDEDLEAEMKMQDRERWYGDAAEYWSGADASVQGMLQGFESISDDDIKGSKQFLTTLRSEGILGRENCGHAVDCGAGIGRVSKHFLLKEFQSVDIVEQCEKFTANVHNYMDDDALSKRILNIYTLGLQAFNPKPGHYDCVWIQWVVGHLTDADFVTFLERCKQGLKPGGVIVIKDNVAGAHPVYDDTDSSVTRTSRDLLRIFKKADISVIKVEAQKGFPSDLFKVNMYALQ